VNIIAGRRSEEERGPSEVGWSSPATSRNPLEYLAIAGLVPSAEAAVLSVRI
jgi:hypothetical protein